MTLTEEREERRFRMEEQRKEQCMQPLATQHGQGNFTFPEKLYTSFFEIPSGEGIVMYYYVNIEQNLIPVLFSKGESCNH